MRLEERQGKIAVVCETGCKRAVAYLHPGKVEIAPRHGHETHPNELTPADLRKLAEIAETWEQQS
jgi:hypothetical protein